MTARFFLLAPCLAASLAAEPVPVSYFDCADPDLEVTVWAASPAFFNPTNIDIDKDGRVWVAEGVNYRQHFDRKPEGDRIMVLEINGDGKADKSWAFVQEPFLRAPMGVAVIGNKVVVSMAPDLIVYTDKDGDLKFDPAKGDTREVILTGFNGRNHDHSLHSVTVGPDGKWYFSAGNCGAKFTDRSGKMFRIGSVQNVSWWPKDPARPDFDPGTIAGQKSDDGKVYVGGFIARMDPDGSNVEILAHNLRNSYENCVTSAGDVFASDNDDQPACRVFWVQEGGNYGFASADGQRTWQADRRPGQGIATATWHQEDPGVAHAGDIYGGGSPTGCVFYENGALGKKHEGTLLVCEPGRNEVFGYKPEPQGAGWKLQRFEFLTTNKAGKFTGTDFSGGNKSAKAEDMKTLFRPSDIAVGPDGALYVADWYDPRVGGHADLDDSVSGTIYRIAPKGFKPKVPKIDLTTTEGAIEALKSPAVHVRALGAEKLRSLGRDMDPLGMRDKSKPRELRARMTWLDGKSKTLGNVSLKDYQLHRAVQRGTALLSYYYGASPKQALLHFEREGVLTRSLYGDNFVIGELNEFLEKVSSLEAYSLAVFGTICGQHPDQANVEYLLPLILRPPLKWSDNASLLISYLHPPQAVPAFQIRALSASLSEKARKDAMTTIGFIDTKDAAEAMLEIAQKTDGSVRATALWWLLNRKDCTWKAHHLDAALKEKGLYDPDKVILTPFNLPEPPPPAFSVAQAAALKGDAKRGQAAVAKCYMCHKAGKGGVEFGPDLTEWGKSQSVEVILRSMIEPSAEIALGFAGTQVETTDGVTVQGLLLSDADPLVIQSQGGVTQMIPRAKVKSKAGMTRSLMMSATQLGMTAQEVADAATFLQGRE